MATQRPYVDRPRRFPATATAFLTPAVIWAVLFATTYAVQGAACAGGLAQLVGPETIRLLLMGLAGVALAGIAVIGATAALRYRRLENSGAPGDERHLERFLTLGAALNAGLFLVATAWSSVPLVLLDLC